MLTRIPSYEDIDESISEPNKLNTDSNQALIVESPDTTMKLRANDLIHILYYVPSSKISKDTSIEWLNTNSLINIYEKYSYELNPVFTHQLFDDELIGFITSSASPNPLTVNVNLNNLTQAIIPPKNISLDEQNTLLKHLSKALPQDYMVALTESEALSFLSDQPSIRIPGHSVHRFQRYCRLIMII